MIPEQFTTTRKHYERYKDFIMLYNEDELRQLYNAGLEDTLQDPKTGEYWDVLLSESYSKDYMACVKKQEYFIGCPIAIYLQHFEERKKHYISANVDVLEIDFIVNEYNSLSKPDFLFTTSSLQKSITKSKIRTFEYLQEQVEKTPYELIMTGHEKGIVYSYSKKKPVMVSQDEFIADLSKTTAIEKVAYLQVLGVLDFIKSKAPLNISETALASVVSSFTGIEAATLKRYLVGIHHEGDKNNPLKDTRKKELIIDKLTNLGLKLP